MGRQSDTGISWTDYTFNAWMGCTKVSPACKFCYAERDFDHRYHMTKWGDAGTRVRTSSKNWAQPHKWNEQAKRDRVRRRVFCASLADVFEDWKGEIRDSHGDTLMICPKGHRDSFVWSQAPHSLPCSSECGEQMRPMNMDDVRADLFKLIDATPMLDWLLLTKRIENVHRMWPFVPTVIPRISRLGKFRRNVWLGTSVENQKYLEIRLPELSGTKDLCPVQFLSCEPLLGPLDFAMRADGTGSALTEGGINWVIAGGESGPEARPSNPDWYRSLRDQCSAAGIPFHFKQWGEWKEYAESDEALWTEFGKADNRAFDEETIVHRIGKKKSGRVLDGVLHDAFPVVEVAR